MRSALRKRPPNPAYVAAHVLPAHTLLGLNRATAAQSAGESRTALRGDR